MKTGLVLEGGGMRGLYTVGVLDWFMEQHFMADYVIGVSAGAGNGSSYVSGQRGRAYRVDVDYLGDKRYISLSNFLKTRSVFGMDFIFDEVPRRLDPFDYDDFLRSPCEFVAGVTDVSTGQPVYFGKQPTIEEECRILRASSAIPMFSPIVVINGSRYLDGGTADPIPVRKALADGCDKVVVVLTRDRSYVKDQEKHRRLYCRKFREDPAMIRLLDTRHELYNETRRFVFDLEKKGRAVVIAPSEPLTISRFEKRREALDQVFQLGRRDARDQWETLLSYLREPENGGTA